MTKRAGAVIVDGCTLDSGQLATLRSDPARQVLSEVILLCLTVQDSGAIGYRDASTASAVSTLVGQVKQLGYKVALGLDAVDAQDQPLTPAHMATLLAQASWRTQTVQSLTAAIAAADGLELAPPQLANSSRSDLSTFVGAVSAAVRPGKPLGIFAPPSVMDPSDIPGGDAFDLRTLAPLVDRVRLMTLDFSCCNVAPGPSIDAAWATDALNLAATKLSAFSLDFAVPLFGTDFTAPGGGNAVATASVNYDLAVAMAVQYQSSPSRGADAELNFGYRDGKGNDHRVYYPDSQSTLSALAGLSAPAVSVKSGVLYYGLGAEDPTLWPTIAQNQR